MSECATFPEKFAIVEHKNKINHTINHTLHLTQRIKFTCFDISQNFLVFGATSGGLYVFSREPCTFLKLIPSKEGCLSDVSISPDEKTVALGSIKGIVSLIDSFDKELSHNSHIYYENQSNRITCMKWNLQSDELYVGDVTGNISVIVLSNFLSKTLFQASSATLMQLDSSIVQLDCYTNYLIVSTLTRSYLCDTQREIFRQIGKKLRDGAYGACFFNPKQFTPSAGVESTHRKGVFRILKDEEKFNVANNDDLRIFCVRPGFRIWEVNVDSSVTKTHQFKDFSKNEPCSILSVNEKSDARVTFLSTVAKDKPKVVVTYNFGKIITVCNTFFLSYNTNAIFIFDAKSVTLLFWTNYYRNIVDVKVLANFIYVVTGDRMDIQVISVANVESIVINAMINKQYVACAELCDLFRDDLLRLAQHRSDKFQALCALEDHVKEDVELYGKIAPVLAEIKRHANKQMVVGQKLKNGIFVVSNNHALAMSSDYPDVVVPSPPLTVAAEPEVTKDNEMFSILLKQYNLKNINDKVDLPQFVALLVDIVDLNEIVNMFLRYEKSLDKVDSSVRNWWLKDYIKHASLLPNLTTIVNNLENNCPAEGFLLEAFVLINADSVNSCDCGYPLPYAYANIPRWKNVGEAVFNKIYNFDVPKCVDVVKSVPYMWHTIIERRRNDPIEDLLLILIQYSDADLLETFVAKLTENLWSEAIRQLGVVKKGICLNCHEKFCLNNRDVGINWSKFGVMLTKCLGSNSSINLMLENCRYIPKGHLDCTFYQAVVVDAIRRHNPLALTVDGSAEELSAEFENVLANCLKQKSFTYNGNVANSMKTLLCVHCHLPVLSKEKSSLKCGHVYHKICLTLNESKCKKCLVVL